jgi:hypothetical protein
MVPVTVLVCALRRRRLSERVDIMRLLDPRVTQHALMYQAKTELCLPALLGYLRFNHSRWYIRCRRSRCESDGSTFASFMCSTPKIDSLLLSTASCTLALPANATPST